MGEKGGVSVIRKVGWVSFLKATTILYFEGSGWISEIKK